jgi:hypothetical protein
MSKSIVSAGDQWKEYMKQFPKLEEFWQTIPEATNTWLSQQIDIFAGKYPASQFKESQPTEVERMKEALDACFGVMMQPYLYKDNPEDLDFKVGIGINKPLWIEARRDAEKLYYEAQKPLDSPPNTQADEDVRDYEASDKPVIEHPCDAPFKDNNSIEHNWLLWIKNILHWQIKWHQSHIGALESRERKMHYEIRLDMLEEMRDAVVEEELCLLNSDKNVQECDASKSPSMGEPMANNSPKEEDVENMAISLDDAKKLRGYFGKNDASHFEHWAYTVFDKIIKSKSI